MRSIAAFALAVLLGACASFGGGDDDAPPVPPRNAWIVAQDGRAIGQAVFTNAPNGVLIRLEFSNGRTTRRLAWPAFAHTRQLLGFCRGVPGLGRASGHG